MRISIPKSVVRLQVAGVAIALLVTIRTVSGQVTSTVYDDDFGRIGALTGSQPTVDPSGAVWTEHGTNSTDTLIQTNGTAAVFPSGVSANDGRLQ